MSVITGVSAGGGCYSPALTDFVVMTRESQMSLTAPKVVREVQSEDVTAEELGSHRVHSRNGVCHFVAKDDTEATMLVRDLLVYLPQNAWEAPLRIEPEPAPGDPAGRFPKASRQVYDVRDVVRAIVDGGGVLEVAPRWARNVVTAFARIDGRAVGIVANQPRYLGGVIDLHASQKAARFVRSVPKLTVVLRKAFGGAFIGRTSARTSFTRGRAQKIGIMGRGAGVLDHSPPDLAAASDPAALKRRFAAEYRQEHLLANAAASDGVVDEVIAPNDTRSRLAAALAALEQLLGPLGGHGNIPL